MSPMLRRIRTHLAALAVVGGLAVTAAALLPEPPLAILCQSSVMATQPIIGTVVNGDGFTCVGACGNQGPLGPMVSSDLCPIVFNYPTTEQMAGSMVTIRAHDMNETATRLVMVQ